MEKDFVAYPVVITPEKDSTFYNFLVFLPEFGAYAQANDLLGAIRVAYEFIGDYSLNQTLPKPHLELPPAKEGQLVTFVNVNLTDYNKHEESSD